MGELRWKAPRPLPPSEQPFAAFEFSDMCPQLGQPMLDIDPALYGRTLGREDCLYLNIWAPPGTAAEWTSSTTPCSPSGPVRIGIRWT